MQIANWHMGFSTIGNSFQPEAPKVTPINRFSGNRLPEKFISHLRRLGVSNQKNRVQNRILHGRKRCVVYQVPS